MLKKKGKYINLFLSDKKYGLFEELKKWATIKNQAQIPGILGNSPEAASMSPVFHDLILFCMDEWNTYFGRSKNKAPTPFSNAFKEISKVKNIKIPTELPEPGKNKNKSKVTVPPLVIPDKEKPSPQNPPESTDPNEVYNEFSIPFDLKVLFA